MRKLTFLFICIFFAGLGLSHAQSRSISGKVLFAENDEPIIGASVVIKGSNVGTITDADGNFKVSVPNTSDILVFAYVGMKNLEMQAVDGMIVRLEYSTKELDDLMVVAYGTATKKSFTGSAKVVSGEAIAKKNSTELTKSLAGEIAGVQVMSGSGQPGTSASIRIRGIGSVNSSAAPLYVVDGMPYSGDISSIDPSDIETTNVLKDATATALYGSRGANGVILITTKKGSTNSSNIEVNVKTGINTRLIPLYNSIDSPEQYTELAWEAAKNWFILDYGIPVENAPTVASNNLFTDFLINPAYNMWSDGKPIDPNTGKMKPGLTRKYTPENWADNIFKTGRKTDATVKFSGGGSNSTYYTSFGVLKDEGYYLGSDFMRLNGRTNVDHKFKSWLKGNTNMTYTYMEVNSAGQTDDMNNGFQFVNFMPSLYPVFLRDANGDLVQDNTLGGNVYDYGTEYDRSYAWGVNPAGSLKWDKNYTKAHQITGNAMLEATFLKDFKATVNFGMQYLGIARSNLTNKYYGDGAGIGRIYKVQTNIVGVTANQILSYSKRIGANHNIDAFIAHETSMSENAYTRGDKSKIASGDNLEWSNAIILDYMASDTYQYNMESYFGQLRYDYNDKYFFHGTFRRDGSSRFSPKHRWGNFGSVGAAWAISNEDFMRDLSFVKNFKYKISWGVLGNQDFMSTYDSGSYYPTDDIYSINNIQGEYAFYNQYIGNKDLTWENSTTFNTGIEFALFNDKLLSGEIEFFSKTTDNLLFSRQMATSPGYATRPYNDAKMLNQGIEFDFNVKAINTNAVKLNVRLNGAHYTNKLLVMPKDQKSNLPKNLEARGAYGWSKGHSLYDFYVREWAGVNPETGAAQWYSYYNQKADGSKELIKDMVLYESNNTIEELLVEKTEDYGDATKKYIDKSAIAKLSGGFGFDLDVYGIEFSTTFAYRLGGYAYDGVYATLMDNHKPGDMNWHKDILDRWTEPGQVTNVPRLSGGAEIDTYQAYTSSRFVTSSNFLHLSSVRLGYTFPKKLTQKININTLNIYATGENLFLLSARKGFAPISSFTGASDRSDYTPLSSIVAGIKITF